MLWFNFCQNRQVKRQFPAFCVYEHAFKKAYRFSNPFRLSKEFLKKKNALQVDAYGETPLLVLARLAKECGLCSKDRIIEMGCGRGIGVFFLSYLVGCPVVGIDWVPTFIDRAKAISNAVHPQLPVEFLCQDMVDTDLSSATCIYLYGTCLDDAVIEVLVDRFEALGPSVKIVTVSYPLNEYSQQFYTETQWMGSFPWGEGEVYVNRFKAAPSSPLAEAHKQGMDHGS